MNTYAISYKGYYHELSEWDCEYVRARDEASALRQFAKTHDIPIDTDPDYTNWRWEENDWVHVFKFIKQITLKRCPHCDGTGEIHIH
jgi:hypothetical protein